MEVPIDLTDLNPALKGVELSYNHRLDHRG